jgi:PAS domain S-box-containing protein
MRVIEVLEALSDRLSVAMVICEHDGESSLTIKLANNSAAVLFGYPTSAAMIGLDVKSLMPSKYADHHDSHIQKHMSRRDGIVHKSSIMGQWRDLEATAQNGDIIPVSVNVADVKNSTERYFVAIFQDRRRDQEERGRLEAALEEAKALKAQAEEARLEADQARAQAEDNLHRQKKLSAQVSLLRQIFGGTVGLIVLLAVLVVIGWQNGQFELESLAMFERILLVLTGMLGSAMAGVFDSRNSGKDENK